MLDMCYVTIPQNIFPWVHREPSEIISGFPGSNGPRASKSWSRGMAKKTISMNIARWPKPIDKNYAKRGRIMLRI